MINRVVHSARSAVIDNILEVSSPVVNAFVVNCFVRGVGEEA